MNIYFDADYQKQLEKDRADYQKQLEKDRADYQKQLEKDRADYQKQLEKDRADYQKEEIMLTQMNAEEIDAQIRAERELEQSY